MKITIVQKPVSRLKWMILLFSVFSLFSFGSLSGQTKVSVNEPFRDDSLTDRKLIIGHHMTKNNPYHGKALYTLSNFGPDKAVFTQIPLYAHYHKASTKLEEYIEWEIRAAKKMGLDGFDLYYPHNSATLTTDMVTYDNIIIAYLKTIEEKNLDFKITLSLAHPKGHTTIEQAADGIATRLKKYFEAVPDAKAWLKTPDGRYLWFTHGMGSIVTETGIEYWTANIEESNALVKDFFRRIEEKLDINIAVVFHIHPVENISDYAVKLKIDPKSYYVRYINAIYDNFAGITGFADVIYDETLDYWSEIFRISRERKKSYPRSIFIDYTRVDDDNKVLYIPSKGSWHVQKLFEQAIEQDCDIVRVISWSDFQEGHNLQPDETHNFGFGVLLNYYKNIWKGEPEKNNQDVGIVFTKKYDPAIIPTNFPFRISFFSHILPGNIFNQYLAEEKNMNIVTLLTAPGDIYINDVMIQTAQKGLTSLYLPITPGPVKLTVKRNDINVVDFSTEEWLTNKPFRTDVGTYTFSSLFKEYYDYIFEGLSEGEYHTSRDYVNATSIVENHSEMKIRVFPNPVMSNLYMETDEDKAEMKIINVTGNTIGKITLSSGLNSLNFEGMRSGIYFLVIETKHGIVSHNLLKL